MTDSEKLDLILSKMCQMETRISQMESDIRNIELTIQNEIRANIREVAEGHLNLSKNLQGTLKAGAENELLSIRVNMLQSEIREVKGHLRTA